MGIGIVLDLIILFALVGGILWNMKRGFLRALVGTVMLFLALTFAALLYSVLLTWFDTALQHPGSGRTGGSAVFGGMLILFYSVLEYTVNRNYPHLRIERLGVWDNILGAIVGIAWSMLAISLALMVLDFAVITVGGQVSFIGDLLYTSFMVKVFRAFFQIPMAPLRLLFPKGLPEILQYFTSK
jgi:uncharacterized membrane protein required for colicin V production